MATRVLWLAKGLGPGGTERLLVELARASDPPRAADRRLRPAVEGPPRRRPGAGRGRDGVPLDAPPRPELAAPSATTGRARRVRHRPQPLAGPCRRRTGRGADPPPRPPSHSRHDGAQHLDVAPTDDPLGEPPHRRARRGVVRRDDADRGDPARSVRRTRRGPRARHRRRADRVATGRRAGSGQASARAARRRARDRHGGQLPGSEGLPDPARGVPAPRRTRCPVPSGRRRPGPARGGDHERP